MEKLTLKNPIMIDGKEVKELSHDANEINGMLFATAESKKKAQARSWPSPPTTLFLPERAQRTPP